jgi:RHS repeat-associated protein
MVPDIQLQYDSQQTDGLLGVGWSLSGFPAIRRCQKTLAVQGVRERIMDAMTDAVCLDSESLKLVSGTNLTEGAQYRTERETFSRIIAHGSLGTNLGPQSFTMESKEGRKLEFGSVASARVVSSVSGVAVSWHLNKVSDRAGNYFEIDWVSSSGATIVPSVVRYTMNSRNGQNSNGRVEFSYQPRPDPISFWQNGLDLSQNSRLSAVKTFAWMAVAGVPQKVPAREYQLTYETPAPLAAAPKSRLISVRECNGGATQCLPATAITWPTNGLPTIAGTSTAMAVTWSDKHKWFLVDVLGAGATQVVGVTKESPNWMIRVFTRSPTGTYSQLGSTVGLTGAQDSDKWVTGDLNGDGRVDLVGVRTTTVTSGGIPIATRHVYTFLSNGDGTFAPQGEKVPTTGALVGYGGGGVNEYFGGDWQIFAVFDVNGDGLGDIMFHRVPMPGVFLPNTVRETPVYSNCNGTLTAAGDNDPVTAFALNANPALPFPMELDGDGRPDSGRLLEQITNNGNSRVLKVLFSVWAAFLSGTPQPPSFTLQNDFQTLYPFFIDANGDGKSDIVAVKQAFGSPATTKIFAALGRGDGTFSPFGSAATADDFTVNHKWFSGDLNGDGLSDLARLRGSTSLYIDRWLSNGNGTYSPADTTILSTVSYDTTNSQWLSGDVNGDGFADIVNVKKSGTTTVIAEIRSEGGAHDHVTAITDGLGAVVAFDYAPLTNPIVYTKGTGATACSEQDVVTPLEVVSAMHRSDGIGGLRNISYRYTGMQLNLRGRGLMGFASKVDSDLESGFTTTTTFRQQFPVDGFPIGTTRVARNGVIVSQTSSTIVPDDPNGIARVTGETETVKDLDGSLVRTTVTTQTQDTYSNPLTITKTTTDGQGRVFTEAKTATYDYDVPNWKLGLLRRTQTTSSAPGVPSLTRVQTFTYDPVTALAATSVTDAESTFPLTKTFGRNLFGLIETTMTSGPDITTRTATTTYTPEGVFPLYLDNEKSQRTERHFDPRFGTLLSETTPNNVTTRVDPDALGRNANEYHADGVTAITTYNIGGSGCGVSAAISIDRSSTNGDHAVVLYDSLGREVCTRTIGFGGKWTNEKTTYDSLGRVSFKSRPYFDIDTPYGVTATYDDLDRAKTQTSGDGGVKRWDYTGLSTRVFNALGNSRLELRDGRGLIVEIDEPGTTPTSNTYQYDALGNATRIVDPGGSAIVSTYDVRGNRLTSSDPDRGSHLWSYDSLGLMKTHANGRGQVTTFNYDVLSRMISRIDPQGTFIWEYDTATNGIGLLSRVTGTALGYLRVQTYDTKSRPVSETVSITGMPELALTSYTTTLTYSTVTGRLDTITYPSGLVARNVYDTGGFLQKVVDSSTSVAFWTATALDAESHVAGETAGNGIVTSRSFDPKTGRLSWATSMSGATQVESDTYSWDLLGSLLTRDNAGGGASLHEAFGYDLLSRLTSVTPGAGTPSGFMYDTTGNIVYKSDLVAFYSYGTNGGGPHAVSAIDTFLGTHYDLSYDPDGNQTQAGLPDGRTRTATYVASNRPATITATKAGVTSQALFNYGPDDEMIVQVTINPTERVEHFYAGATFELAQTTTTGKTEYRSNILAYGKLVAIRTEQKNTPTGPIVTTSVRYPHMDHLGSITMLSDSTGNVVDRTSFDAWGLRRAFGSFTGAAFATVTPSFTGHKQLDSVGLIHMDGRAYDPLLGRFTSADPFAQPPDSTQEINPYSYVLNNPVSAVDPTGARTFGPRQWFQIKLNHASNELTRLGRYFKRFARHYGGYVKMALEVITTIFAPYLLPVVGMIGGSIQAWAYGGSLREIFAGAVQGAAQALASAMIGVAVSSVFYIVANPVLVFLGGDAPGEGFDANGNPLEAGAKADSMVVPGVTQGEADVLKEMATDPALKGAVGFAMKPGEGFFGSGFFKSDFFHDLAVAIRQKLFGPTEYDYSFMRFVTEHATAETRFFSYSQGTLVLSNAISAGAIPRGASVLMRSPAVLEIPARISAVRAGISLTYDMPWFDGAGLFISTADPAKLITSTVDLLTLFSIHRSNSF